MVLIHSFYLCPGCVGPLQADPTKINLLSRCCDLQWQETWSLNQTETGCAWVTWTWKSCHSTLCEKQGRNWCGWCSKWVGVRDCSQTLMGGDLMQIKIYHQQFLGPLYRPKTKFRALFLSWKLWVNPIENHVDWIFTGKFVVIFGGALTRVKNLEVPLVASVCPGAA